MEFYVLNADFRSCLRFSYLEDIVFVNLMYIHFPDTAQDFLTLSCPMANKQGENLSDFDLTFRE